MAPRRKARPPAFQFYPADWLSSPNVMAMTPEQEGAYLRLLCCAWLAPDCGLPNDDSMLAVLSRLNGRWETEGLLVRNMFRVCTKNVLRLVNDRLLSERRKQREWKRKSAEGGRKSGEQRRCSRKGGSHLVEPNGQPNFNQRGNQKATLQSSSSSSSSKEIPNGISNPPLPPELDSPEFLEAWQEWVRVRVEIKKPLKATGAKACIKKLLRFAKAGGIDAAIETLENSSAGGYQGLFDPRERRAGTNGRKPVEAIDPKVFEWEGAT